MVFLPGSELTTNVVTPFVCSGGVPCCCCRSLLDLIVVGLEQEAGRSDTLALTSLLYQIGRNLVDCLAVAPPLVAVKKGVTCCFTPHLDGEAVLMLACKKQGSTTLRLRTVAKSGASLVRRAGVAEF